VNRRDLMLLLVGAMTASHALCEGLIFRNFPPKKGRHTSARLSGGRAHHLFSLDAPPLANSLAIIRRAWSRNTLRRLRNFELA